MTATFARSATSDDFGNITVAEPDLRTQTALPAWTHRYEIRFPSAGRSAVLQNFPVLVRLDSSNFDFTSALSDGSNLRFSTRANPTQDDWLAMEIESYDADEETAIIWVKLPLVIPGDPYVFYLFSGDLAPVAAPTDVWEFYEMVLHGDDGENWLVPLYAPPVYGRTERAGRHSTIWKIGDLRAHFSAAINATGLQKSTASLVIDLAVSDPDQMLTTIPDEMDGESDIDDHDGYDWKGGIGLSSTSLSRGGPVEEWWREGIRDLGLERNYKEYTIPLSDWINRSGTVLTGTATTTNGPGDSEIVGSGTNWTSSLSVGDRILVGFDDIEFALKVEVITDNTHIDVQGWAENNVGDNVGLTFSGRTLRKCTNNDEVDVTDLQHLRVVVRAKSHNVFAKWRNARLTWPSVSTNVVEDASGNGNDCQRTLAGTATEDAGGLIGTAIEWDGGAGRLKVSRHIDIGNSSFSLSCLVKMGAGATSLPLLGGPEVLFTLTTAETLTITWGNFSGAIAFTTNVFDGGWHHLCIVRNRRRDSIELFIDGVLEGSISDAITDIEIDDFLYIGGDETASRSTALVGLIDEVRLALEPVTASWVKMEAGMAMADGFLHIDEAYEAVAVPGGIQALLEDGGSVYVG